MLHVVYVKKGEDIFYLSLSTFWMQCNFIEIICLVFFFSFVCFFSLKENNWYDYFFNFYVRLSFDKKITSESSFLKNSIYMHSLHLKHRILGIKFQTSIFRKNTCIQSIKRNTFNSFSCFDKIKLFFSRWDSL